jgi:hypothetical protein
MIFIKLAVSSKTTFMLQYKDINKLSELKNGFTHSWVEPDFIFRSLKCFSFSGMNKELSLLKTKGYGFDWIMSMLITMPFIGVKTVNGLSTLVQARKDVFYRIKNNSSISWRYILWLFAVKFNKIANQEYDNERVKCLIFDDSTLQKTGKLIEKASYIWDHVQHKCVIGFKFLLMGYWDGTSFIPLDFSLHREEGQNKEKPYGLRKKDLKKQYKKKRSSATHAYDRAKEADDSKIVSMLKMLKRAVAHGFRFDYVLVDSWFTCEALVDAVLGIKNQVTHLIGMYKNGKTFFTFRDKQQTYSQIRNCQGTPKRCRKLKLYYHQAKVKLKGKDLQLFFSKQGKNGKWKVILTTDTTISFIRLIEIYQIRWTIEVFFKESKQLLALGKCQSNDFDAQIADLTITMIQYMLLTIRYRYDTYESKGALFDQVKEQIIQQRLNERLWGLFVELVQLLANLFDGIDEMELFEKIVTDELTMRKLTKMFQLINESYEAA